MTVYFSASNISFMPGSWLEDGTYSHENMPSDIVLLTPDEANTYWRASPPKGKRLGSSANGRPCWDDLPPPSQSEIVAQADETKYALQRKAEDTIKPLERAKSLGIATKDELSMLTEWERYSVFLMRVDTSLAPNIEWPQKPQ